MTSTKVSLTANHLREILYYCPDTGIFSWNKSSGGAAFKGKHAGTLTPCGYVRIAVAGGRYYAQQLAWLYIHGDWTSGTIDHINGDKKDNRLSNLREASHEENLQNQRRAHSNNISGLLGVSFAKGRYSAEIRRGRVRVSLGVFATAEDAHKAYLLAKQEIHPFGTLGSNGVQADRRRKTNKTGFAGVDAKKSGKFSASLNLDGVRVRLGLFASAHEASEACLKARTDHFERKASPNQA